MWGDVEACLLPSPRPTLCSAATSPAQALVLPAPGERPGTPAQSLPPPAHVDVLFVALGTLLFPRSSFYKLLKKRFQTQNEYLFSLRTPRLIFEVH